MEKTTIKPKIISDPHREKYLYRLGKIIDKIHSCGNPMEMLPGLAEDIAALLLVERVMIYTCAGQHLYSCFKAPEGMEEIHLPINATSTAGYIAQTRLPLLLRDAYDTRELIAIDAKLQFSKGNDAHFRERTRQLVGVPIAWGESLQGVIEAINKKQGVFGDEDIQSLRKIAGALASILQSYKRMRLHEISRYNLLVVENFLTKSQLQEAVEIAQSSKTSLDTVLLADFALQKKDLLRALSAYYKVPTFAFEPGMDVPSELLTIFTPKYLRKNTWVPFRKEGNQVHIAIDNPRELYKLDDIRRQIPFSSYSLHVAVQEDIMKTIDYFWGPEIIVEVKESKWGKIADDIDSLTKEIEQDIEITESDNVIIRLVNHLIVEAYHRGASDIYIEPGSQKLDRLSIRFRVDGICYQYQFLPRELARAIVSRVKIMAELDIANRLLPQDGKIPFKLDNIQIELRIATLPVVGGYESAVIRLLAAKEPIPLEKIGMRQGVYERFAQLLTNSYGIILVVGPTGSGKTTTLHSALGVINTPNKKIWTAEDPVEITQKGLSQVQVQPKSGYTFARAMRSFLRAAPDVIMIGEMRDLETASTAIEASLTGHLVFSTLHTNTAPETVVRLVDMGIDPFLFGDALLGVLGQRLVRTLCSKCKEPFTPNSDFLDGLLSEYGSDEASQQQLSFLSEDATLFAAKGCRQCSNGYVGRMGLHELLVNSREITPLIHRKVPVEEIRRVAMVQGMTTLKQDGIHKIFDGHTDILQVRAVCSR